MILDESLVARFWRNVEKTESCWIWKAAKSRGYGIIGQGRNTLYKAHRVSWVMKNGEIKSGNVIIHKCDNPSCVNPEHLQEGTQAENMKDMVKKKRHWAIKKTHCNYGHPLTPENQASHKNQRACRICQLEYGKIYREKIKCQKK